ncbi:MAG TPA: hypothetical protein ENK31_04570, partial [Nannocystis exedens]|nr:hypothetical protein [Nannocystis exedens]
MRRGDQGRGCAQRGHVVAGSRSRAGARRRLQTFVGAFATRIGLAQRLLLGCVVVGCGGPEPGPLPRGAIKNAPEESESGADDLLQRDREPLQLTSVGPTETVVIAIRELPDALDPLGALDPWARRVADDLLFEGLVRRWPKGYPWAEPALADRCVIEPGERALRCHLPEDHSFHDGTPVTVEDVIYSLEFWLGPRAARLRRSHGLDALKSVEISDGPAEDRDPGRWIRIAFHAANPLILERIAVMKIVPKAKRRGRTQAFSKDPVGSGPMRLATVDAEKMVFERVDTVDPERTGARRIVLRALPDGAEALT